MTEDKANIPEVFLKPYDPTEHEARIYKMWEDSGYFNPDNLPGERTESFTIVMPPPNANGSLHAGHGLVFTIEDTMIALGELFNKALGNKLVIHADNTKYPFTFFVINNQALNAFAFYGGHVGTHTGLIYRAETESELASVLAHEIAHVTQRHVVRRSQAAARSSPLQIASLIGGAILMMASPQAGIAAISAGNAGAMQNQINYTRTFEKEADRIGLRILFEAGFDPFSAADFFGRLLESKRWSSQAPAFLQTHQ